MTDNTEATHTAETAPVSIEAKAEPSPDVAPTPAVTTPAVARRGGTPIWLTLVLIAAVAAEPFVLPYVAPPVGGGTTPQLAELQSRLAATQNRIEALEHAAPSTPGDTARIQALENRLAAVESRPAQSMPDVEGAVAAATAKLNARIAELDTAIQKDIAATTARATLANRLRAAAMALEAGKPLGAIPDAPAALARFADTAPPTEPALRLAFPRFAQAARTAAQPAATMTNPVDRAWERVQALVTIRKGDKVLVGSHAATVLEAARGRLDAGDLEGALLTLNSLEEAAKQAVDPWRADAQSLLDARAAMLSMAAKS